MTDPLSISAGIIAIFDSTEKVIKYGLDFIEAIEKKKSLRDDLETFKHYLTELKQFCDDALKSHPDPNNPPPRLRALWEVKPGSGHRNKEGKLVYEYRGDVAQLKQIIDKMSTQLTPSTNFIKKSELYQRATWHYKKDAIDKMQTDIARCCARVDLISGLTHGEKLKETHDSVKYYGESNKIQLTDIGSRLSTIEINQKQEAERKRIEEARKEREEITDWLSPLNFRGKQEKLWSTCFQETGDWLWQDQRFKVWAEGSPWYLQWFVFSK